MASICKEIIIDPTSTKTGPVYSSFKYHQDADMDDYSDKKYTWKCDFCKKEYVARSNAQWCEHLHWERVAPGAEIVLKLNKGGDHLLKQDSINRVIGLEMMERRERLGRLWGESR
jgi:hypothetical protein